MESRVEVVGWRERTLGGDWIQPLLLNGTSPVTTAEVTDL